MFKTTEKTHKPREPEALHLAMVLFTVQAYLERSIHDGLTKEPVHFRIVSGIEGWKTMRRFNLKEVEILQDLGKDDYMGKLKNEEVSFVVYALQLAKRAVEAYDFHIGVGKKHLRKGRANFALEMVKLKYNDNDKYKELRQIIDASVINANKFFDYTMEKLHEQHKSNELC